MPFSSPVSVMGRVAMSRVLAVLGAAAVFAACSDTVEVVVPAIEAPTGLSYVLEPSGDPLAPAALKLYWNPVAAADLMVYRVYSRPTSSGPYDLRGETTSLSFHDIGVPDLYYAVSAVNTSGGESELNQVLIDERLRLAAPSSLTSTSLNGAIYLGWSDNPFLSDPDGFYQYRVYSASFSLDDNLCGTDWVLEGTTVAPEFIAGALTNGVPRCFAVSAESIEGWESLWSPLRADTPRPDARNVVLYADEVNAAAAGFRFWQDLNGNGQADANELGLIQAATAVTADFWLDRDAGFTLYFVPSRANTQVQQYGSGPVGDLTSIDYAPLGGYSRSAIEVLPGYGYVFEMDGGDGFARYGAIRATHVGRDFIIFDWSYQTDPGNPELDIRGGLPTSGEQELVVRRR
jgi:hypothetical protein